MIRAARPDEFPALAAIESAAALAFRGTPMEFVLALPAAPAKPPAPLPDAAFIWVCVDADDRPVGFLEAEVFDGWLHILEISVHPAAQRRGHARALIERARSEAVARRLGCLSLTTDHAIAWNGPSYRRMGFVELAPAQLPGWLAAILQHEISLGFDPARRVAMALPA